MIKSVTDKRRKSANKPSKTILSHVPINGLHASKWVTAFGGPLKRVNIVETRSSLNLSHLVIYLWTFLKKLGQAPPDGTSAPHLWELCRQQVPEG
jgi:hypothetical protein